MNLLETLIRPDLEEQPERAEVARAANLLQVGEFQLLQLAYDHWFGRDMPPGETDRLFAAYMLRNQVPHWARHFARRIIAIDEAGELDDADPAWHRYDPAHGHPISPGARRFAIAVTIIVVCLAGGLITAQLAVRDSGKALSQLPPYFGEKELVRAQAP